MKDVKKILGDKLSPLIQNPKISEVFGTRSSQEPRSVDEIIKSSKTPMIERMQNVEVLPPLIQTEDISAALKRLDDKIVTAVSILSENQEEIEKNYLDLKKQIQSTNKRVDGLSTKTDDIQKQLDLLKKHMYGEQNIDKFDPHGKFRRFKDSLQETLSYRTGQVAYQSGKYLAGSMYSLGSRAAGGLETLATSAAVRAAAPYAAAAAGGVTALGILGYGGYKAYNYFFGGSSKEDNKDSENKKFSEEIKSKKSIDIETEEFIISSKNRIHLKAEKEIVLKSKKIVLEADEVVINDKRGNLSQQSGTSTGPTQESRKPQENLQGKSVGSSIQKPEFSPESPSIPTFPGNNERYSSPGYSGGGTSGGSGGYNEAPREQRRESVRPGPGTSTPLDSFRGPRPVPESQSEKGGSLDRSGIFPGTSKSSSSNQNQQERTTGPITADEKGRVNPQQYYDAMVEKFRNSKLNGFVPKDGEKWGIKTGSPEEWARFATMLTKGESGTSDGKAFSIHAKGPNGEPSFGISQMKPGEYGLKSMEDVLDPEKASSAMIKQFEKFIIPSGHIGGRGSGPGTYDGWRGAAAYFGPIRTDWQQKQSDWFNRNIKTEGRKASSTDKPLINLERVPTQSEIDASMAKGNKTFHFDPDQPGAAEAKDYIKSKGGNVTAYWQGGGSKEYSEKEIDLTSEKGLKEIRDRAAKMAESGYDAMQVDNLDRIKSPEQMKAIFDAVHEGSKGKIKIVPNGQPYILSDFLKQNPEYKDKMQYALGEHLAKASPEERKKLGDLTKSGARIYDIEFGKGKNAVGLDDAQKAKGYTSGVYWYNQGENEDGKGGGITGNQNMIYTPGQSYSTSSSRTTGRSADIVNPEMESNRFGMSVTKEKDINVSNSATPKERFSIASHVHTRGMDNRLIEIGKEASKYLPEGYRVEMTSGHRHGDRRYHGQGKAADFTIYDDKGRKLSNYQSPETFRIYEKFAQDAKKIQSERYPELNSSFAWGGYFGGSLGKTYGAMDLMHLDLGGKRGVAGSFESGLNSEYRRRWSVSDSVGMGRINDYRLPDSISRENLDPNLKNYIAEKYGLNFPENASKVDSVKGTKIAEAPKDTPQFKDPLEQTGRPALLDSYLGSAKSDYEKYKSIGLMGRDQPLEQQARTDIENYLKKQEPQVPAEQLRNNEEPRVADQSQSPAEESTPKSPVEKENREEVSLHMDTPVHDPERENPKPSSDGYGRQPGTDSIAGGNE